MHVPSRIHVWLTAAGLLFTTLPAQTAKGDAAPERRPLERHEFTQMLMGMPFKVVLYAADEATANAGAKVAFGRIKALNFIMSDYEPESELMRLCQTAGKGTAVKVSTDLLTVLSRAQNLSERSHGAFDVSVGPLIKLWRKSRRSKLLPPPDQLSQAQSLVGYRQIHINEENGTVELAKTGMRLDLGGIAVGYAVDQALAALKQAGITSALIDGSGDIGVSDAPPGSTGWRIGIAPLDPEGPPSCYLMLKHSAVTTSGDALQHVEIDGQTYSHIVDPKTGLGLREHSSVTVVAKDCTTADSYATAACILGPARGLKLIEETPGAAAFIVRSHQGKQEVFKSKRLGEYLEPASKPE